MATGAETPPWTGRSDAAPLLFLARPKTAAWAHRSWYLAPFGPGEFQQPCQTTDKRDLLGQRPIAHKLSALRLAGTPGRIVNVPVGRLWM